MSPTFWERPEIVDQFASRDPDHRLVQLVSDYDDPPSIRVLDLGCAGGRNTAFLAESGFDVWATDTSEAMVERTRERVGAFLGEAEARRRVVVARMDDLSIFPDRSFHLVVALGVYHNAHTMAEWDAAVAETARILMPGAALLVNQFTPEVDLTGEGLQPVPGEPGIYDGLPGGRALLLDARQLDTGFARHGLYPVVPSETVTVELETGRRVSVNALYRRD